MEEGHPVLDVMLVELDAVVSVQNFRAIALRIPLASSPAHFDSFMCSSAENAVQCGMPKMRCGLSLVSSLV